MLKSGCADLFSWRLSKGITSSNSHVTRQNISSPLQPLYNVSSSKAAGLSDSWISWVSSSIVGWILDLTLGFSAPLNIGVCESADILISLLLV
ncbi:hypothetical protein RhiirA4_477567 [Rhizophagus irregularis]|uniref:Uncharacterized protein n=1 Tax=Rhizophagus irregularis TaxID=588596 RepID=A0A2I1HDG6_9GLOM|nr:hypothetical protein RhiirA4_477567 [Rhizophagus irregularis]